MRSLARLTWAANRIENGDPPATVERAPRCPECRRLVERLPDGTYTTRCSKHMDMTERRAWWASCKQDADMQDPASEVQPSDNWLQPATDALEARNWQRENDPRSEVKP